MIEECNNLLFDYATFDIIAAVVITAGDQTLFCFITNKRGILLVVFFFIVVFYAVLVHCTDSCAGTTDATLVVVVAVIVLIVFKYVATVY